MDRLRRTFVLTQLPPNQKFKFLEKLANVLKTGVGKGGGKHNHFPYLLLKSYEVTLAQNCKALQALRAQI